MKTRLIFCLLLISALPAAVLYAQVEKYDLASQNLKGNIKSLNETIFEAEEISGSITRGKKLSNDFYVYNTAGFKKEEQNEKYDILSKISYKYDANNRPVEITTTVEDKSETTRMQYNASGLLEETTGYKNERQSFKTTFKYNQQNRLEESTSNYSNGSFSAKRNFFIYYGNGNLKEHKDTSNFAGGFKTIKQYKYNTSNLKTDMNSRSFWKTPEEIYQENTITYAYDLYANILEEKGNNHHDKYTYTYDKNNNWIKRIRVRKSTFDNIEITEREIKYYDTKDIPPVVSKALDNYFEDGEFVGLNMSIYDADRLCEEINKIKTTLGKIDKSALYAKGSNNLNNTPQIWITNFRSSIEIIEESTFSSYSAFLSDNIQSYDGYKSEFLILTGQLKKCLNKNPLIGSTPSYSFYLDNALIEIAKYNTNKSIWIRIKVIK